MQHKPKPPGAWSPLFRKVHRALRQHGKTSQITPSEPARGLTPLHNSGSSSDLGYRMTAPMGQVPLAAMNDPNWRELLAAILMAYGHIRSNNFGATTNAETLRNRRDILHSTMTLVMSDCQITTLAQVTPDLLPRMFELWTQKGVGKRAQVNYFNVMRWYWRVFGIEIEAIGTYAKKANEFTTPRNARQDKSWAGNGVDFETVYQQMFALDPVAAHLLVAIKAQGLGLQESLGGPATRAWHPAFTTFDEANLRALLGQLTGQVPDTCLFAWRNRSLAQAKDRMRYLAKKLGLTKSKLGVTYQGLRADFSIDKLNAQIKAYAPAREGQVINYKMLSALRHQTSDAIGQSHVTSNDAYYGNFLSMAREQLPYFTRSWDRIEGVMNEVGELLVGNDVPNMYWIGVRALGASSTSAPYEFTLPPGTDPAVTLRLAPLVCDLVLGATGVDCIMHHWDDLPEPSQVLWKDEAIPVFLPVRPMA